MLNTERLLNQLPNVPHRGLLKRLILQAQTVEQLKNLIESNNLIIPKSFWELIENEID